MKVIVISGPTASGKTDIAIELAQKFGGEVVNFDSLLLYKEINIGTAKPTSEERKSIPHHMIDVRSIREPMNAADYAREALPIVEKLLQDNKTVYLVGGSGFYLQALLKGMYDSPTTPSEISRRSHDLYIREGIAPFRELLRLHDPKSFQRYHENDHYRIRRAVEHWWTTGSPLSGAREEKDLSNAKLNKATIHNWDLLHIYLNIPKEEHWKIIEERTEKIFFLGLVDEVEAILKAGFSGAEKPLQSIGYKEVVDLLQGRCPTLKECKKRTEISTRQLAKSQRTWFNRDPFKVAFNPKIEERDIISAVENHLNQR